MLKNRLTKKILAVFMLIAILFSNLHFVSAVDLSSAGLFETGKTEHHLQYWNGSRWSYVTCTLVYHNVNGKNYPAFCLNRELPGVGELDSYTVSINDVLRDDRIWRAITAGYPYVDPASLGLSEPDAFLATKMAVYSVIDGRDIRSSFRGGDAIGNQIVNVIEMQVNEGRYGTRTRVDATISLNKVGAFKRDPNNANYYMQEYSVSSNVSMDTYTITDILGFPSGTIVTNLSNGQQNTFNSGNNFKVLVPVSALGSEIKGTIVANGRCKSYPIFYGISPNSAWQNYAITYDPYSVTGGRASFNATVIGQGTLTKSDRDTGENLSGAIYDIYKDTNNNKKYDNGEPLVLTTGKTNSQGIVNFQLGIANYVALEKTAPTGYNLSTEHIPFSINVDNLNVSISAKDKIIVGHVEVTKQDRDTGENLSGADYYIYKDNNNNKRLDNTDTLITTTSKTNSEGKTLVKDLKYGNYLAVEKTAPSHYNLDNTPLPFSILKEGETVKVLSTDLIFKGTLDLTKVERGNENLKLSGAVYDIYEDANNNKRYDEGEKLVATTEPTSSEGKVTVPKLRYNNYVAVEKIAPIRI